MTWLRAVVPLLCAGVLAVLAVLTVRSAGCADPGHYEFRGGGYELVGGCIAPSDLVLPGQPVTPPPEIAPPSGWPARS
ncbi:hypothetical protein [Pseudonocardia asaccharolytica]|uniref:Uncharacterized protein n=1 Tax=Pseudonocardia asaccharolytica DSM 44247 = NBRC 16224 TaxID=1123024 RepID=A0A511D455_9PSEU|nr:hypothetical protein [Pseudonocardia asaccharolytica]GEL19555.1 hypothetical protein PA7_33920 [Pseudonocardia asaccharolytica DSM 44247 = NBRC 16224]